MESVAQTKPIVQNYRPKGGLFEYYGRKTKDGAVMSPARCRNARIDFECTSKADGAPKVSLRRKKRKKQESRWTIGGFANDLKKKAR